MVMEIVLKSIDQNFFVTYRHLRLTLDYLMELKRTAKSLMVETPYVVVLNPGRGTEIIEVLEGLYKMPEAKDSVRIMGFVVFYSKACALNEVVLMTKRDYEERQRVTKNEG